MNRNAREVTKLICRAARDARKETGPVGKPPFTGGVNWPMDCTVGPGLEGAIACETSVGYVDGTAGRLIYRGYDIFDLSASSTFEEVSWLLLHGELPTAGQLTEFEETLAAYRCIPQTLRELMSFPVEQMNPMEAMRLGSAILRREVRLGDNLRKAFQTKTIGSDEDSIPEETMPYGEHHAKYEFKARRRRGGRKVPPGLDACYRLIGGMATIAAAITRLRQGKLPIEADPKLGHAANLYYMMTGEPPSPLRERVLDVALILHADHGMNASTFASMVVASTLSDFYLSIGSGIAALNGPLHGGANEQVLHTLNEIGTVGNVKNWYAEARKKKRKVMGFGHRVYKSYDPRARVLGPLADFMAQENKETRRLLKIARSLEKEVVAELGSSKGIYPNVDFYSGIVYGSMGIPAEMFTPIFAVSRVAGWSARVLEYLQRNRIFRPRAIYVGPLGRDYVTLGQRESQ